MATPPPYENITGIYTVIDKHHSVSKADYAGTARPGQIIVDTSDYTLHISDASGQLAPVGGAGPSLAGYATEAYVDSAISDLVDSSPATLDTLNELAAALGNDENFATTTATLIGTKADASSLATVATSGDYADLLNAVTTLGQLTGVDSEVDDPRTANDFFVHDGTSWVAGSVEIGQLSDVSTSLANVPTNGKVLTWDSTGSKWVPKTVTVAGANVTGNVTSAITANFANFAGNITIADQPNITSVGTLTSATISGNLTTSGTTILTGFTETVTSPTFSATFAPNVALSSIIKITATSDFTFDGFTSPVAGQSATVIVTQDGTGSRLLTSTMKFAGGAKTLSTAAGAVDVIGVFYDGSTYYASLTLGYA